MKFRLLTALSAVMLSILAIQGFAQTTEKANPQKSVTAELDELTEKSNGQVPPKILEAGRKGNEEIRASGILKTALNVGGKMPSFSLNDSFDKKINSDDLLKEGHLIIVFYRGAWCPFCNLYLRGMQRRLPEFKEQGANLIAVSVEPTDKSLAVSQKNKLNYTVLSDPNLNVARKFGIVYEMPKVTNDAILEVGFDIAKYNNMEKAELPLSATYVVSSSGEVVYTFLEPDYKKRADPNVIIDTLKKLNKSNPEKTNKQ
jgi:peroxiredoxin